MNPFRASPAWSLLILASGLPFIVLLDFALVPGLLEAIEPYYELTSRVIVRVHVVFGLSLLSLFTVHLLVRGGEADLRQPFLLLSILSALVVTMVVVAFSKEDLLLEASPITFFTSLALFLASVVAACNAFRYAQKWSLLTTFWILLSLAFLGASLDESLMVHEKLGRILENRVPNLGPFRMDDVVTLGYAAGGLVFAIVFILTCFRHYLKKDASFYLVFFFGVVVYGVSTILDSFDTVVAVPQGWSIDWLRLANTVEEVCEFLAASLFVAAFILEALEAEGKRLLHICERRIQLGLFTTKTMLRATSGASAVYLLVIVALALAYWPRGQRYLVADDGMKFDVEVFADHRSGLAGVDGLDYREGILLVANEHGKKVIQIDREGNASILAAEGDGFSSPEDVLIAPTGEIYVSDDDHATVSVIAGGKVSKILGPEDGLRKAEGLALDAEGNLYIADEALGAVLKLVDGKLEIFVSPLDGIEAPEEIIFDRLGNLYVTDDFFGKVFKIDVSGECTVFADARQGLQQPEALAIYGDYVYITDSEVGAVFRFDLDGRGKRYVSFRSIYKNLEGLAVDEEGVLYIAVSNIPPLPSVILKLKERPASSSKN